MLPSLPHQEMTSQTSLKGIALAAIAAIVLPACGPSAGPENSPDVVGALLARADGTYYRVEANEAGSSTTMSLMGLSWGRLVEEVYDDSGVLVHRDLVIGSDIRSDGVDYQLSTNPISQTSTLTILYDFGTEDYSSAFNKLFDDLDDLLPKSLASFELPPYSMVPRNSVLVLRFSDLLEPSTVNSDNILIQAGYTPNVPFSCRLVPDVNFGASVDGKFYSTRVLVDPVVTEDESQVTGLPINGLGFDAAMTTGMPNLAVRIPTALDFGAGQFTRLENRGGKGLNGVDNAPFDYSGPTVDVIRALRTGGSESKVGDINNGFLSDENPPQVIGNQAVTINNVVADTTPGQYLLDVTFANTACATTAKVGDIITQPGVFAEVVTTSAAPVGGQLLSVNVRLLTATSGVPFPDGASYRYAWSSDGVIGADCFVEFDPPAGTGTNVAVDPTASVILRFSEPMDPDRMSPFDAFVLSEADAPLEDMQTDDWIIGEAFPSPDLKRFRFVPRVPFERSAIVPETYFLHLFEDEGVVDLAGNPLADAFPTVPFFMDVNAPQVNADQRAMRFGKSFEEPLGGPVVDDDGTGGSDIRGQFVFDPIRGVIAPRPVDRFSQTIDRNVGVPGWMVPNAEVIKNPGFLIGTFQEPLNPLGCKMMSLWRYFDMGLDVIDEAYVNIDVEHINWAPIGSKVLSEFYPDFSISLATSNRTPDETWTAPPNTLIFPTSGLDTTTFDANVLQDANNPQSIVHEREEGYFIDPIEKFNSDSETLMFPYPMNKYRQPDDYLYWTYRDTAILAVAGSDPLIGLEPPVLYDQFYDTSVNPPAAIPGVLGSSTITSSVDPELPIIAHTQIAVGDVVPSFGLPILTEFRCYSSDDAIGINRLDTSLAMDPSWAAGGVAGLILGTSQPFMRIHSSGGTDTSGKDVYRDPDLETAPRGGFNYEPQLAPLGVASAGADNVFYMGQLDFVVRISRVHTVWTGTALATPLYAEPVLEPRNEKQPDGTSIQLHFRGATNATGGLPFDDANLFNMYGNIPADGNPLTYLTGPEEDNAGITFDTATGSSWVPNMSDLNGLRFFQVRITFINNPAAGTSPELSGLGFAYQRP